MYSQKTGSLLTTVLSCGGREDIFVLSEVEMLINILDLTSYVIRNFIFSHKLSVAYLPLGSLHKAWYPVAMVPH